MQIRILLIVISLATLSGGCSIRQAFVGSDETRPIIESNIESGKTKSFLSWFGETPFQTLSTKGERRLVIFKDKNGSQPIVCAEPSPDLAENISHIFSTSASIKKGEAALSAEALQAFSTAVEKVFERSNAIQFQRDAAFTLCQARMNGWIMDDHGEKSKKILEESLANTVKQAKRTEEVMTIIKQVAETGANEFRKYPSVSKYPSASINSIAKSITDKFSGITENSDISTKDVEAAVKATATQLEMNFSYSAALQDIRTKTVKILEHEMGITKNKDNAQLKAELGTTQKNLADEQKAHKKKQEELADERKAHEEIKQKLIDASVSRAKNTVKPCTPSCEEQK